MKKLTLFIVVFILLSAFIPASKVWADGGYFPRRGELSEPTQKAAIFFDGKREDLIIEVSFNGATEDFAWVVPVPHYPKVIATDKRFFDQMEAITSPIYEMHQKEGENLQESAEPSTIIHERYEVGFYDISIISSTDSFSLVDWLKQNGYNIPARANNVLQYYIDKKWYFVAMRINPEDIEKASQEKTYTGHIYPIKVSFDSEEMIYPLRISSINNGRTEILLYLFCNHQVYNNSFQTEYYGIINPDQINNYIALKEQIKKTYSLTILRKTFYPEEMIEDLVFNNQTYTGSDYPYLPPDDTGKNTILAYFIIFIATFLIISIYINLILLISLVLSISKYKKKTG